MEDLIERIHHGEITTILIDISSTLSLSSQGTQSLFSSPSLSFSSLLSDYEKCLSLLITLSSNLNVLFLCGEKIIPISSSSSLGCQKETEKESERPDETHLKTLHQYLTISSIILLVDFHLTFTSSENSTDPKFSDLSQTIVYHLGRKDLATYCLHPPRNMEQFKSKNKSTPSQTQTITFSRRYLNNIPIIHLV
jgi:hypothetical protein